MKLKLKTWLLIAAIVSIPIAGYALTPSLTFDQLRVQQLPKASQKLSAIMWDDLVTYVENLQIDLETLQNELADLKNKETTMTGNVYDQVPLGTIIAVNGAVSQSTMNKEGWARCNGTSITSQVPEADLTGYTPNLAGKTLVGEGTFSSYTFKLGDDNKYSDYSTTYNGEVRHTLSLPEIPSHNHSVSYTTWKAWDNANNRDMPTSYSSSNSSWNTSSAGGGQSHNNMSPFYVVYYYMKVKNNSGQTPEWICKAQTYSKYGSYNWSVGQLMDGQSQTFSDYNSTKRYTVAVTVKCSNGTLTHSTASPKCNNTDHSYNYQLDSCGAKCSASYSWGQMMSDSSCYWYSSSTQTFYHGSDTRSYKSSSCSCDGPYSPQVCINGKWYNFASSSSIVNNYRQLKSESQISTSGGSSSTSVASTYDCTSYRDIGYYSTEESYCNSITNEFTCNWTEFKPKSGWGSYGYGRCNWSYSDSKCHAGYWY